MTLVEDKDNSMEETNEYGLTFEEWLAAAQFASGSIRSLDKVLSLRQSWKDGVDPTEYNKPI